MNLFAETISRTDFHEFERFMKRREDIASAYVRGETEPLSHIVTQLGPATFFGPDGTLLQGAENVWSTYEQGGMQFGPESQSSLETLQMDATHGIGFWVGIQHANVHMKGQDELVPMDLRVTEIYRREGQEWKLIHRHADILKPEARP